ncbi:Rieske 2Fe-2S domain-containing protein [Streptomyces sp. NPDC002787]
MTSAPAEPIRTIEAEETPTRYARGWHCLGLADIFRDGKPHAIEAFGTKLVVFADSHGALHVLDAYCRHMGGDLSRGEIKGDQVACPFHDWRWGGDGRCKQIPYAKRVPLRARTRTWHTLEKNQQLFVWHDHEGNAPDPAVEIPAIAGAGDPQWTSWTWNQVRIDGSNCREIVDNVVDMAHFFYVHFAFPTYFKNVFEGHIAGQYMTSSSRPDVRLGTNDSGESEGRSEAAYYGPSYMIDYLWQTTKGKTMEIVLINCHYPVTPTSFVLQWGVIVKKPEGMSDEVADTIAASYTKGVEAGFLQDIEIWKNKTRIDNPLLCEEDGPVYQLRRWYEQFYVDADRVEPEMTRRFEFEIDTGRANEFWRKEVEENFRKAKSVRS